MNDKTTNVVELRPKSTSDILTFFHCKKCLEELPDGESPAIDQYIDAGWTEKGFQVWCLRHDMNIISIDFEGHTHPVV